MVEDNGTLREIYHPDGGPWGGTLVDQAFKQFLISLLGKAVLEKFSAECKSDELYLRRNFEMLKRRIKEKSSQNQILRIPRSLLECAGNDKAVKRKIEQSQYKNEVELKQSKDKLSISGNVLEQMFAEPVSNLIRHVKTLFSKTELQNIRTLILVGGFSESAFITNELRMAFPNRDIIVPHEPNLAVLKGAVLFGHNPKTISSRKMAFTYGISTAIPFDENIHPEYKRVFRNGVDKCEDVFKVFFEVGQTVIPDKTKVVHTFNTSHSRSDITERVEIYKTKAAKPIFVSDSGLSIDLFAKGHCGNKAFSQYAKYAQKHAKTSSLIRNFAIFTTTCGMKKHAHIWYESQ